MESSTFMARVTCARIPLDFISCVQTCTSSWISSGATSVRDHASSHRGRGAGSLLASALDPDLEGVFDLKTFLKNGMARAASMGDCCARSQWGQQEERSVESVR